MDIEKAQIDFNCPDCEFINTATLNDVVNGASLICVGCLRTIQLADSQLDGLNDELLAYRETEERGREKKQLEKDIKTDNETIEEYQKKVNEHIVKTLPFALAIKHTEEYKDELERAAQDNRIPPEIVPSVLEEILAQNTCICGQHIQESSRNTIEILLEKSKRVDEVSYLGQHTQLCKVKLAFLKNDAQLILDESEEKIDRFSIHRDNLQTRLHVVEEELRKSEIFGSSVENPQVRADALKKRSGVINQELGVLIVRENTLQEEQQRKREFVEQYVTSTTQNELIQAKILALTKAQRVIGTIEEKIIHESRKKVESGIIETFKLLHWKPEFKRIELDDDFHVTVIRNDDTVRKLGDLSVGERKMLGLSIINSLSRKLENFDFPFFIDGPVEELDESVAPKVLENLKALSEDKQVFVMTLNKPEITEFLENVPAHRKYQLVRKDNEIEVTVIERVA